MTQSPSLSHTLPNLFPLCFCSLLSPLPYPAQCPRPNLNQFDSEVVVSFSQPKSRGDTYWGTQTSYSTPVQGLYKIHKINFLLFITPCFITSNHFRFV